MQFQLLRESDRTLLKKAEAEVLNRHVNGEMAGAIVGGLCCAAMRRRFGIAPLARRDFGLKIGQRRPPFIKYWTTDYPANAAAGLVGGRLAAERDGWRRGQEILAAEPIALERIRKTFGAEDVKSTIRTYRYNWYQAKGLPEWAASIMYHFAYLSP